MSRDRLWWDRWHLGLARYHATASKDPSTQCGAVIIDRNRRPVSSGYNGFPRGVNDSPDRYEDRSFKYPAICHAERNAILFAKTDLTGCTLYTTLMPCAPCAGMIIQAGIREVVCPIEHNPKWETQPEILQAWLDQFKISTTMFEEAHVSLRRIHFEG